MMPTVIRERGHRLVWQGCAGALAVWVLWKDPLPDETKLVGVGAGMLFLAVWAVLFVSDLRAYSEDQ